LVLSDSEDFTVIYTAVSIPFGGLSDIGSLGVDGTPVMLEDPYAYVVTAFQAPPLPDYVPGPKEPEQAPPLPEFVLEPEDPVDYPTDRDDDDEDKEEESFEDKADEEEEEYPAPADSISPPHIDRLLAIPSPLPSPLSPWSSPLPQILSPQLPISSLVHVSSPPLPASPTYPLGYRAAMIRLRAKTPSTSHLLRSGIPPSGTPPLLPLPLPNPSPPLILPSTSHKADVPEVTLSRRKRLCITLGLRYEVDKSSSAAVARPTGDRHDHAWAARLIEIEARLSRQAWV
nr:hypothetical protein [Tanacetum cinerariifolium]